MTRFWLALIASASATLVAAAVVGWAVSWTLVAPPPEMLMTATFELDLADGWICFEDGTEWVCRPDPAPKDTIAVIAIKYRTNFDTMETYAAHLKKPQRFTTPDGTQLTSRVEYVREIRIGGYQWVDATHFESEIPNYYTRYLATVTSHVGVLVTFSTRAESSDRYNAQLEAMIESLRIYERPIGTATANR